MTDEVLRGVEPPRRSHAVLDLPSRSDKARKIERLLGVPSGSEKLRLLEVGTGSGGIAHYFGTHISGRYEVHAVDVVDSRQIEGGYEFQLVAGTVLPFADEAFDIVLSNHVIEHVGDHSAQTAHLTELRRVLRPGGRGYLAVPNRWMLVEPHYRLAFLSWLPRAWRSTYVRAAGKGEAYDCEPLTMPEVDGLLAATGFEYENVGVAALRETFRIEGTRTFLQKLVARCPDGFLKRLDWLNPTLVYVLRRVRRHV